MQKLQLKQPEVFCQPVASQDQGYTVKISVDERGNKLFTFEINDLAARAEIVYKHDSGIQNEIVRDEMNDDNDEYEVELSDDDDDDEELKSKATTKKQQQDIKKEEKALRKQQQEEQEEDEELMERILRCREDTQKKCKMILQHRPIRKQLSKIGTLLKDCNKDQKNDEFFQMFEFIKTSYKMTPQQMRFLIDMHEDFSCVYTHDRIDELLETYASDSDNDNDSDSSKSSQSSDEDEERDQENDSDDD
jgi:hypothetical protein